MMGDDVSPGLSVCSHVQPRRTNLAKALLRSRCVLRGVFLCCPRILPECPTSPRDTVGPSPSSNLPPCSDLKDLINYYCCYY